MALWLFKSKKEKARQRVLDSTKDNVSRIKAFDYLEELASEGDVEAITTMLKCFSITVKPDKQEQTLTPYDDEQEKLSLIDRLTGLTEQRATVLKLLRKELANPPLLSPGRRDGVVWLIELLRDMAEATTDDEDESAEMVRDELIRALEHYDPEETYRDPERKVQLIQALGRHKGEASIEAVRPFLKDVDETVRFRAVETIVRVGDDCLGDVLSEMALEDESLRIQQRAMEVMAELNCSIKGHPRRKELEGKLPATIMVDKKGVVRSR